MHHDEEAERLCGHSVGEWVYKQSGFSGSRALLMVGAAGKTLVVDSRYTLQAHSECVPGWRIVEANRFALNTPELEVVAQGLGPVIGYDPAHVSVSELAEWKKALPEALFEAHEWLPGMPASGALELYSEKYAGRSFLHKKRDFLAFFAQKTPFCNASAHAVLIASPASIAWLLNLRAQQFAFTPIFPALALCAEKAVWLWTLPGTRQPALEEELGPNVHWIEAPYSDWAGGAAEVAVQFDRIFFVPEQTPQSLFASLEGCAELTPTPDWLSAQQAVKVPAEIVGAESAHKEEALAVISTLAHINRGAARTEWEVVELLEHWRLRSALYRGPSFASIVAAGANAAIVHYTPRKQSSAALGEGALLLDVGGQYLGGTTDLTRTVWLGAASPPQALVDAYTCVLRGHIALAEAVFPKGASGGRLDTLARQFLWKEGEDYGHGTGHGVGNYLSVHEGPHSIAPHAAVALEEGMIVSNEPGVYRAGEWGVRLENLLYVKKADFGAKVAQSPQPNSTFLRFSTLSWVPFESTLINWCALDANERAWLRCYHARVMEHCAERLDVDIRAWLESVCVPFFGAQ